MPKQKLYFLCGLPRTGSTVLTAILSQNPKIYCTGTSAFGNVYYNTFLNWNEANSHLENYYPEQKHNLSHAMLNNAYLHIDKPIIIDKNRRWPVLIDLIKETSNIPIKIIAPVRNITDIVSSFLTLADATEDNYVKKELNKNKLPYTKQNACKCIADTLIRDRYIALKTAFYKHKECFLFLEYNDIVNNPNTTIKKVYNFLDLPSYKHDYSNLVNMEPEKDAEVNGFANLHTIRPMLAKKSKPVIENIGKDMFEYFTSLKLEFWKEDITIKT